MSDNGLVKMSNQINIAHSTFFPDPREWPCTDDSPFNNGNRYVDEFEEREEEDEDIELENKVD